MASKLIPQNFTTYSHKWCPDEIVTHSTTEQSWSSGDWVWILELEWTQDYESLSLVFVDCYFYIPAGHEAIWSLYLDGNPLRDHTFRLSDVGNAEHGFHYVKHIAKGTHTLKLGLYRSAGAGSIYAYDRRITVLNAFLSGGN